MGTRTIVVGIATALLGSVLLVAPAAAAEDFYQPPEVLPAGNGDVIRTEDSVFHLDPLKLVRAQADVTRVMYASEGARERVAVTGSVIVPRSTWKGPGARPVVAYAVGTQGMADRCAPSRQLAAGSEYEGLFIQGLLSRGYTVVVTDYEGLGTPGAHTYVSPGSLGRSVLDSVRAAQRLDLVEDEAPILLSGYSEGGNAVGGAVEQATAYAPELDIAGAYAGAVPADLKRVAPKLDGSLYAAFLGYAVVALDATHPELDLRSLLNERGRRHLEQVEDSCTIDGVAQLAFTQSRTLTTDGAPVIEKLDRPDISAALEESRLGTRAPSVPTLVVHSRLDDVVDFAQGRDMARSWCSLGAEVDFRATLTPTHVGAAVTGFPRAFAFLEARIAGKPLSGNCGRF
ncbi:lipase family protein [Aeromicrobium sp. CF4.19]|uniref:lipase family protein n=1 Tax=Aeromicrobium sp. CF4.19 TaxID=3373082 RepID=UPI003EE51F44